MSEEPSVSEPSEPLAPDPLLDELDEARPSGWAADPLWLRELTPRIGVTYAFVAANVAVFLAMVIGGVSPISPSVTDDIAWGGNIAELTTNGQWWRLFTCTFVHAGIVHLLFNMYVLWKTGRFYERLVGPVGFALVYLFSGTVGALASILWRQDLVSVGASGAVFGIIGGLGAIAARRPAGFPTDSLKPLGKSVLAFLGYNLVFGLMVPNIDLAGHVGGLLGGFAAGLVVAQPLDAGTRARRRPRNAILAGLGLALVAVALLVWPRTANVQGTVTHLAEVETRVLPLVTEMAQRYDADELSGVAMADRMEAEVLAPWREVGDELAALERIPPQREQLVRLVRDYVAARDAHWSALADAVRADDPAAIAACHPLGERADQTARAIQAHVAAQRGD